MNVIHKNLKAGRWYELSLLEQLGNIGSEVGRSIKPENREGATERALELFDLTLADDRWAGPRRKEIARAREFFCKAVLENDLKELEALDKYFYLFALAARINK